MRFEDLDKKIKEAADQHHPAYDENAWRKMEKLLNVHLPQSNNDRRRVIFFLLFFLLIGGGIFILISKPWEKNSKTASQPAQEIKKSSQPNEASKNPGISSVESKTTKANVARSENRNKSDNVNNEISILNEKPKNLISNSPTRKATNSPQISKEQKPKDYNNTSAILNSNDKNDKPLAEVDKKLAIDHSNEVVTKPNQEEQDITRVHKNGADKQEIIQGNEQTNEQSIVKTETKNSAPKKNRNSGNRNGFSFSFSAGPDVSKVESAKTGKTTLVYGAGIGYTKNRFTLRTGVYGVKKVYWAGPNDYKLSYTPPPSVKFEGADADCYVIEIPVKLNYNFGFRNKSNWFASAGLASYLMKRESYSYVYKPVTGGPPYYHWYETKNENKHYFSVLNLSGGFTRQLNNIFSISAEPYIEIPLTGIGAGKVHLNSGGVLFTIGVKPFRK
jgi:hypothetical protein